MIARFRVHRVFLTIVIAVVAACTDSSGPGGPTLTPTDDALGANQSSNAQRFRQAASVVLALPATVYADHDEATDRLVFGVENASTITAVQRTLAALGISASDYEVRVTAPVRQVATLRDRWRPTQGGIQIHFGLFVCTLGFNADDGGERSFITNSHCTDRQGGVDGTEYFQPLSSVDGTVIAIEVEDPEYFRGGVCPVGRRCRYSDASRALYSASVASTRGAIAQTSGPNNGSLEVTGAFRIQSQDNNTTNYPVGITVNKVGRTTGWTRGNVIGSCIHTNVFGSNITQLCQTFVQSTDGSTIVAGGDSGSNVFRLSGPNAELIGILWGSSGANRFVFSPLKNVRDELGPIVAVR